MPFPSSPLLPTADLHSLFLQLLLIFMLLSPNHFFFMSMTLFSLLHPLLCAIFLSPLSRPLLPSYLPFLLEYLWHCSKGSLQNVLLPAAQAYKRAQVPAVWWEPGKGLALKVWKRPAHHKLFQSTALSLFIANSTLFLMLCCRGEPCLGHDHLLNFQQYVNIVGPTVSTATEVAMLLIDTCHAKASVTHA